MADKFAPEVIRSLHAWGFDTRTDPTAKYATQDSPGRADVMAGYGGKVAYIEIKNGGASFDFGEWRENQRLWARWCKHVLKCEYWLFLVMGTDRPNARSGRPRKAWLLPADKMLEVEKTLTVVQTSLPYAAIKGYSKILQENRWDAINLLVDYELPWSKGYYALPQAHPFYISFQPTLIPLMDQWKQLENMLKTGDESHVQRPEAI